MSWPTPQDYNEAIQNPQISFQDLELKGGSPELNQLGLPRSNSGSFASVYRMQCRSKDWAVRCFLRDFPDQATRYEALSSYILTDDLDATVDFHFQRNGILVRGAWFPILKMEWVKGLTFVEYIEKNLDNRSTILSLAESFKNTVGTLEAAGVAHGDLQHGNILITSDTSEIRLVDYDGMFVPDMHGITNSNELGHRNYQHPGRSRTHFGPYLDNFSAWTIYLALRFIAADPGIWKVLNGGDECLLFREADYQNPDGSSTFKYLRSYPIPEVREGMQILDSLLALNPDNVPPLGVLGLSGEAGFSTLKLSAPGGQRSWAWLERTIIAFNRWRFVKAGGVTISNETQPHSSGVASWIRSALGSVNAGDAGGRYEEPPIEPPVVAASNSGQLPDWLAPQLSGGAGGTPGTTNTSKVGGPVNPQPSKTAKQAPPKNAVRSNFDTLIREGKAHIKKREYYEAAAALTAALKAAESKGLVPAQIEILRLMASMEFSSARELEAQGKCVSAAGSYQQAYNHLILVRGKMQGGHDKDDDFSMTELMFRAAACYERDGQYDLVRICLTTYGDILCRYPNNADKLKAARERMKELPTQNHAPKKPKTP